MRLTILGGSAAGANPGQGCSGYLIESGSTQVVVDLGSGTFPELRRHVDFRSIDAVILSHTHLDHCLDVLALRYALAYNPIPPKAPIPLWLPPGGFAFLDRLASALSGTPEKSDFFSVFETQEYDPNASLTLGELEFRFHPTVHYIPCWAVRVSNGIDGDFVYTADTGPAANLTPFSSGARVMVAEGTYRGISDEPVASRGHLTAAEAGILAREAEIKVLILSHLWIENDPLQAIQDAEVAFGGDVILATSGFQLSWEQEMI